MSEPPLVSVIIPVHNYASYVAEAVRSAEEQDGPFRLEIVAVDDGSTDGSPAVLAGLAAEPGSRLRVIRQENAGLSAARNTGLAHARGDFIQFLDADDLLAPDCLRSQLASLEAHPEADASVCCCICLHADRIDVWQLCESRHALLLCASNIAPPLCFFIRRSFADDVGLFDVRLTSLEDHDYWLRGAALGKRFVSNVDALAVYRQHDGSMSRDTARMFRMDRELLLRAGRLLRSAPAGAFPPEGRASGLLVNGSALLGCAWRARREDGDPESRAVAKAMLRHAVTTLRDALDDADGPARDDPVCRLFVLHIRNFLPAFPEKRELRDIFARLTSLFPEVAALPHGAESRAYEDLFSLPLERREGIAHRWLAARGGTRASERLAREWLASVKRKGRS